MTLLVYLALVGIWFTLLVAVFRLGDVRAAVRESRDSLRATRDLLASLARSGGVLPPQGPYRDPASAPPLVLVEASARASVLAGACEEEKQLLEGLRVANKMFAEDAILPGSYNSTVASLAKRLDVVRAERMRQETLLRKPGA